MASNVNVRREGKGRVTPGPSSLHAWGVPVLLALAVATGARCNSLSAWRLGGRVSQLLAAVIAAGAAVALLVLASRGARRAAEGRCDSRVCRGCSGLFGAPYVVA
jgi:hypothetical protein